MADIQAVLGQLTQAAQSARAVRRCFNGGRDLQESSHRAIMLLVDVQEFLYFLKDSIISGEEKWLLETARMGALVEVLTSFASTMKSMELYFQPGGVGVTYYRKRLLERTFLPRLEQYKVILLLSMQPDSGERLFLDRKIRASLRLWRETESGPKVDLQFEERILGFTSQLASENFITLADLCNRRLKGTGQWIFDDDQYKQWLLGSMKTLYCVGPPGVGKTFLSAAIIDSLQRTFTSSDVASIFIFCQEEGEKEQTTLDLLQNILAQLIYRKRSLSYASSSLYHSEHMMKGKASPKVYQNAIRAEVDRFSKVFFIIDGLDMLSDKERFIARLQKLPDQVQLLVTLREAPIAKVASYITVMAPPSDIHLYAMSRIQEDHSISALLCEIDEPQLYQEVINMVSEKSHGVLSRLHKTHILRFFRFLLAKIHLDLLLFERALAYGEAMKQVSNADQEAMSFEHSLQTQNAVTEYLTGTPAKDIAETCLTAITPDEVVDDCYYNARYWGYHAREVSDDEQTIQLLWRRPPLQLGLGKYPQDWTPLHVLAYFGIVGKSKRILFQGARITPLHCAASRGNSDMVEFLLDMSRDGSTALHLATEYGQRKVMKILLHRPGATESDEATVALLVKNKVDVNTRNIHTAIEWRRLRASINMTNENGFTPLQLARRAQLAAYANHWVAFDLLVIGGADINAWNKEGDTSVASKIIDQAKGYPPLHCAAAAGNKLMFMYLVERGAKIGALTAKGESLLLITPPINDECIDILKFAVEKGLSVNVVSNEGWTPLHLAVYVGAGVPDHAFDKIADGADVNARLQSSNAETPLHLAVTAIVPRPNLVSLLIKAGAEVDSPTLEGKTSLHLAAERGREGIFRIIHDAGADISLEAPDSAKADDGNGVGTTAFDLALKNPFALHWFGSDGKLRPAVETSRRDSVGTVIEEEDLIQDDPDDELEANGVKESEEDDQEAEKGTGISLMGDEMPYVIV
ncbi:hypothetical protein P175DRAFT_0546775 [Aspergillus ochraceoroseus IBT 24754]|uniref:Nephrocystin 3-like N-terminal domain-containing protein n=1 Tax=Aspergillus ochraceoroseus IBT 24754 TaxID=1392256 RepID=A0A2T5LX53_9EURO|nr:uncharacterized protein P175DRAFT_0546775 [Aspergillus ochraceoroseus IBT 24754]PTU20864.1 hypothetical protein P175DRAFT_0546775 [Aspergillus ochraceoroseus IBT 24754]